MDNCWAGPFPLGVSERDVIILVITLLVLPITLVPFLFIPAVVTITDSSLAATYISFITTATPSLLGSVPSSINVVLIVPACTTH